MMYENKRNMQRVDAAKRPLGFDLDATSERISELIIQSGLDDKYIAEMIKVTPQAVNRWRHKAAFVTVDNLYALSKVLGISIDKFFVSRTKDEQSDELKNLVIFGWDEEAQVWVAEGQDPVFALEHESIVALAERVKNIIPELQELEEETSDLRELEEAEKMGMYDTFLGKYTCLHCGNEVEFQEQTKAYEQCLEEFKLGDYIDRGNRSYFYDFTYECPLCHAETDLSIGIRRGQYVGVFLAQDARIMDPEELVNIEDGYQRHREYEKMCEIKLGTVGADKDANELVALVPGETLDVLETTWTIIETFYEKNEDLNGWHSLYHPSVVYRVHSGDLYRIIAVRINPFTRDYYYEVCEDGFEESDNKELNKSASKYHIQCGCTLIKLDEGGVIWKES